MEQFTYKNHTVTVHEGYNGKSIYIRNADGEQIYAHKFTGDAMDRAKMILGEEVKAVAVAAPTLFEQMGAIIQASDAKVLSFGRAGLVPQSCGCIINFNDKFTEKFCIKHGEEDEQFEAERDHYERFAA